MGYTLTHACNVLWFERLVVDCEALEEDTEAVHWDLQEMSCRFLRTVLSRLGHFPVRGGGRWAGLSHAWDDEEGAGGHRPRLSGGLHIHLRKEGQDELHHVVSKCPCELLSEPRSDLAEDVLAARHSSVAIPPKYPWRQTVMEPVGSAEDDVTKDLPAGDADER